MDIVEYETSIAIYFEKFSTLSAPYCETINMSGTDIGLLAVYVHFHDVFSISEMQNGAIRTTKPS